MRGARGFQLQALGVAASLLPGSGANHADDLNRGQAYSVSGGGNQDQVLRS